MLNFDKLLARFNRSVTEAFGENLVRNGDFSHNRLKDHKKWGTMQDTGDGSWFAEEGRIEVQKASGHGGTPAKYMRSNVLELDALTGRRGLGATESNATLTQQIEEITGPGTYRLSLDYRGAKSSKYGVEDTGTAEIWIGDKLVTVLSQGRPKWEERIIEFTLTEEDIPENGVVDLKLASTGKADGRGAQLDNISLREIGETGLLGGELVHNGGFEDHPPMNRGRHGVFEELPGWEVSSDSVIELKSVRKPATPRDKKDAYIELDSHGPGSNSKVEQEIDVPEDGIYLLSFDYSPRGRGSKTEETSSIKVMAGDQVIAELSSDKVGWKPFTFNVDLVEGPLKLSFEGTGTQDTIGGLLDNVELRKVADLGPEPDPVNTALDVPDDPEEAGHGYASGLLGEVHFADAVLTRLDQALSHVDDTPDATFVATEIDYGNHTGWFHNPLAKVLEHDADSLVGHSDGALEQNVDHTVMQLTGEIYLEAGKHRFFNRTDDGFRLTIDGQEIAEFEGLRPARTTQGAIEVAESGWYDIAVDYFEWKGHSKLRIEHRAPDGKREILDDDRLRHKAEDENGAPVALDDAATTAEDTPVTLDLLANDSDPDGDALSIVELGPVENGDLALNTDGTVTFSPDADFNGTVSFDYTISDGIAESAATVTIEVSPVNDAPVAADDAATTSEDTPVTLNLLANDSDPDGDALSIVDLGSVENGDLTLNTDGTVTFSPDEDYNGTVSVDYMISDGQAQSTATATVEVTPVNDAPVAADDAATTAEDTPVTLDLLANDSDPEGDALSIVNLGPVENGALALNPDGTVTFTPDADYNGTVSFDYTISDGMAESTATATIEVTPVNDAPVAEDDAATTAEDTPATLNLLANDSDPDGDALSIVELGPVEDGELTLNADGTVTFGPDADFNGTVSFDYTISDGQAQSTATATVEVTPVNDAPVAEDDAATTAEDTPIILDLLANDSDPDGDALSIVDLGPVETGELTLNPDGTVTFSPDADFNGTASFDYAISDGQAESTATATIEVMPVNDHPVASNDFGETEGTDPVNIDVLANDTDVDGDSLFIVEVGDSADGTIDMLSDGTLTFTATDGFAGTTSFLYTISDGAATDTAEVTIDVSQANRPPEPADDFMVTDEDTPVSSDPLANDLDLDGDALTIVALGPVESGTLDLNADGTVTFSPDADYNGTVSFNYTISDGQAESTATATIEVTPVNDHPVATSGFAETEGTDSVTIDVLANDSDVDGDTLFIVDVGDSADGTIDIFSDGTLTFTANDGFAGITSFQYTISDGAATDTAEVTIDVSQANRPPEPADDFVVTDEDTPVSFDPLANDLDLDGDALTIVALGPVESGTLDLNADGTVTFSPDADYNGTVSFDYTVSDGQAQSIATATVEVMPVNDPATAGEDAASTLEDTPVTMDLLANDADVDGDALSIVELGPVENGELALNADGTVTFTPDADFNGTVNFDYTISDGMDLSTGIATVEVVPVNDPLSAEDDWARVDEDRAISLNLTLNDRDVDRDDLFVVDLGPVENGTASLNPTGTVTFTPDADFHGTASFDYIVSDGVFESSATVIIEVTPINDHPVAQADFGQTEGVAPVILDVLANDSDVEGDALTIVDPGTSPDGTVELFSDGTIAFTANEGFFGTTTFVYTVSDGAATDTAEVTIEVLQQNRPPEPENDVVTMAEDTSITIDLLANDGDPDGDPLTITAFGPFLNGSLDNHGDGTVSFTPDADYTGYIVIGYTVADDEGLTGAAQLHIAVENVNDAPVAVADAVGMDRGDTVMVNVLANDIDIDSAGLELVSASSARGSVSIVDGRIIFDPLDDFAFLAVEESADEVITYTIRDDEGLEALGTLTVTVTAPRQDRVNESLSYTERGAGGNTTDLDGEAGFQAIGFVGLAGFDNNDRLSIDLDSRGGLGRSSARGDHGEDGDAGPGGDGTSATVAGGLGGAASAELFNAFLTGNEYDDRLDVVVDAFAGRGGKGGDGGDGGDASPLGIHTVRQFGGGEITTDYGEGAAFDGGNGGDGADGADGGDANAGVRNGVFDGGDDDDDINVEVEAVAGNGGNGGGGGRAGDGGNDRPFGGSHVNESISGDGGNGGHGGDSFAEVDGAQMLGGSGDDRIELVVVSEAGKGGIGGQGGRSGEGQYLDTIFTNNGLFLPPEYEGELFAILGAAGDGGDSGDNGDAQAVVTGNMLDGGDGDDEILLEIIAETPDAVSGAAAGNSGVDGTLTPEQTGDYTVHQTAGTAGAAGADGTAGSATIIATGNTISGGAGNDVIEVVAEAITQGTATLTFEGNSIDGGAGHDIADFSKFDVAMDFDLAAGTFTVGTGAGSNAIDGIEHLIATIYDDVVSGSGSAETLTGGEGSDTLVGGGGQDVFVFDEGDGADTIEDFSGDVIDLTSHTGALDFAGLDLTDTAEGALIAFATGDTILLRGIDAGQLAETNFAF